MSDSIQFFQIDAFADHAFAGNPAAVCLMTEAADDQWLQNVAMEMNLSETAFVWRNEDGGFHLRWLTPTVEVDLCGHATLAASHALWQAGWLERSETATFQTRSGQLEARLDGDSIWLNFPAKVQQPVDPPNGLSDAMNVQPIHTGRNDFDLLVEVLTEAEVRSATPDFEKLLAVECRGLILTSKSDAKDCDFVSRFFCPAVGVNEDPVTGSAHVCLAPYWAGKLGRNELTGFQASKRGGKVQTRVDGDRVHLGGKAITILEGRLLVGC